MVAIEEGRWPLVVVRWAVPVCGCDLDVYRVAFERWLQHGERFALVSIASEPVRLPACRLEQIAAWMQRRRFVIATRCAGLASVLPKPMTDGWRCAYRTAASAQLGCPAAAFAREGDALLWAVERLRGADAGAALSPAAEPALETLH